MTYREALRFISGLINYERSFASSYRQSLKLDRARDLFARCGFPQQAFPSVHVAGTKGKGSVSVFIASILRASGYTTGLYTSPHLYDIRERIRILVPAPDRAAGSDFEGMIGRRAVSRLVAEVRDRISDGMSPTFFEALTALAFLHFKEQKVDCAVLETGMGGRLDATNVVEPLVAVLTPVSLDHVDVLGPTVRRIAAEKAGIIKAVRHLDVVSARQPAAAAQVIRSRARSTHSRLIEVGRDVRIEDGKTTFSVLVGRNAYRGLRVALQGEHQRYNAGLAVAAADALIARGFCITPRSVRQGLVSARWPCRCDVVGRRPFVVVDGCQNRASAEALCAAVREFAYRRLILVFGMSADKDIRGTSSVLKSIADAVILTRAHHPRAAEPGLLAPYFKGKELYYSGSVREAKHRVSVLACKEDMILVCGSLFVAGEYKYGICPDA